MTSRAGMQRALSLFRTVQSRQRRWRSWMRVAWWLVLLPAALACWAAGQHSRPRQLGAWGLTGVALLAWVGAATGIPGATGGSGAQVASRTPGLRAQPSVAPPNGVQASPSAAVPSIDMRPATSPSALPTVPPTTISQAPMEAPSLVAPVAPADVAPAVVAPPVVAPAPAAPATAEESEQTATVSPVVPASLATSFANCAAMHQAYPHGVGMPGAVDHVSGRTKPVTTFARVAALYEVNASSDRDGDQIACEQA